jgi:hypothetical protein
MRRAIDRRLVAVEQAAISKAPEFRIIRVTGGLPGPIRCAHADGLHWQRLPDEPTEVFEKRIIALAQSAQSKTVIFGGLCPCAWQEPGSFEKYLAGPDFRLFNEE